MTWTKLGDEFSDAAWNLSDAAWRTHVEALLWSNRFGMDLVVPKRHLPRFALSEVAGQAAAELCATGWWKDTGDFWDISARFAEWQLESAVVERRRADAALRQRRHRMHKAGNHTLCLAGRCPAVTRDETRYTTGDPGRDGMGKQKNKPLPIRAGVTGDEFRTGLVTDPLHHAASLRPSLVRRDPSQSPCRARAAGPARPRLQ
jgi:hypothetical protein